MKKHSIKLLCILGLFSLSTIFLGAKIITPVHALSPDSGYTLIPGSNGNLEYANSYVYSQEMWIPFIIVSAPPGSGAEVTATTDSASGFIWNVGGNGVSQSVTLSFTANIHNNGLEIYYGEENFYYTDVKEAVIQCPGDVCGVYWYDLGNGLAPTTPNLISASQWGITVVSVGGGPIAPISNYVPSTPSPDGEPYAPATPFIAYNSEDTSNYQSLDYQNVNGPTITRSDSVQLTNGYQLSLSFGVKFLSSGSLGVSVPVTFESGYGTASSSAYTFQGKQWTDADWVLVLQTSKTGYFQVHPAPNTCYFFHGIYYC